MAGYQQAPLRARSSTHPVVWLFAGAAAVALGVGVAAGGKALLADDDEPKSSSTEQTPSLVVACENYWELMGSQGDQAQLWELATTFAESSNGTVIESTAYDLAVQFDPRVVFDASRASELADEIESYC